MGLLSHIVLVKVRAFHRFTLHTRRSFLLLLFQRKHTLKTIHGVYCPHCNVSLHFYKLPYLACCFHGLVLLLICSNHKRTVSEYKTEGQRGRSVIWSVLGERMTYWQFGFCTFPPWQETQQSGEKQHALTWGKSSYRWPCWRRHKRFLLTHICSSLYWSWIRVLLGVICKKKE